MARRTRQLLVLVRREDSVERFTDEHFARLKIIASQALIRPRCERDRRNYEEREQGERESRVVGVNPVGGADAHPARESFLHRRSQQPEKAGDQHVEQQHQHAPLASCPKGAKIDLDMGALCPI